MNPQTLNPYVYCLNNPLKYIDPDGEFAHDHDWVLDSLYLTWQDMWDASHSDDRNDHWDPDKAPISSRSPPPGLDYNLSKSWGVEVSGSLVYFFGLGGGAGWVKDENGSTWYTIEQQGWGLSGGGDVTVFCSSLSAEEVANSVSRTYEVSAGYILGADFQISLNESGDIIKFNIGWSPGLFTGVYWDYVRTSQKSGNPLEWVVSWLKDIF